MIPYFKQEKDYTCGPAVVRMILSASKIIKSENELVRRLKTTEKYGTRKKEIQRFFEKERYEAKSERKSTLRKIKFYLSKGYNVIVCYFYVRDKTGHYAIMRSMNEKKVILVDPWCGPKLKFSKKYFRKIWHDTQGNRGWFIAVKKIRYQ